MLIEQLNLDRLLAKMWDEMGLVRVYTKPQGQQPDFADPVVLSSVSQVSPINYLCILGNCCEDDFAFWETVVRMNFSASFLISHTSGFVGL